MNTGMEGAREPLRAIDLLKGGIIFVYSNRIGLERLLQTRGVCGLGPGRYYSPIRA
jgi:hypothetical protein